MKVSVILPSYNVKNYIRQCIESVLNQTLNDIEVLCVDAFSNDGTLEIIKEYAKKDSRITIILSEKKSYGYQLNLGVAHASGKYIGIVETDDYIKPEMYNELYEEAYRRDADFVKADFDMFITTQDNTELSHRYNIPENTLFINYDQDISYYDYIESVYPPDVYIWNGIYKTEFIKKHGIRFNETPGAAYQDCGFRYQVALSVRHGFFIDKCLYHYRRDNISASTYSQRGLIYDYNEMMYLLDLYNGNDDYQIEKKRYIARGMFHSFLFELRKTLRNNNIESLNQIIEMFRKEFYELYIHGILRERDMEPILWWNLTMLIEDCAKFCEMQSEMIKLDDRRFVWILEWARKDRIVFVGDGHFSKYAYTIMAANGLEEKIILCDNNEKKQGKLRYGKEIENPADVIKNYPDSLYLITANRSRRELRDWLIKCGVKRDNISYYIWPIHAGAITERRI